MDSGFGLTLQYWKMDRDGNETLCRSVDIDWHDDISDEFGNSGGGGWFNQNYQYRFILISHSSVGLLQNVQVDFIKITTEDPWTVGAYALHGGSNGTPNQLQLMQFATNALTVSGSATYTFVSTPGNFNPSMASIIAVSQLADIIIAVTASDSTTFTFTLTHRAGAVFSLTNFVQNFLILMTDYYPSL